MWKRLLPRGYALGAIATLAATSSFAADADHGKTIAKRWCASCHLVERDQKSASDQAPPFASVARMPEFDENRLAFFLLEPHPKMPNMALSRAEVADLADYISTLK
jgi:mono/diheme cytochrome c family protein